MPETRKSKLPYVPTDPSHFEPEPGLKEVVAKAVAKATINRVKLQSIFPARVILIGPVSGERYDFPEAGSILEVDERDMAHLLDYRIGHSSCCGGSDSDGNRVFQKV